ncbi:hypothetical protein ACMGE6_02005 [Macrococcus equi]|uniref:hypothetical protein n=1 Tax=Macrococcus equi TaxID=3395462 RepID=UPI0039BE5BA2
MNKLLATLFTASVVLSGCLGPQEIKTKEEPKEDVSSKKEDKAESAKKKIKENKKKKEESTTEASTTEMTTTELPTTEMQTTEVATTETLTQEQPTSEMTQANHPTQQQIIDFCKNIQGGIPEVCRTPAIVAAGNQKGAIEQQASADLEAGLITEEQYNQRLEEATGIMDRAWEQEFGVNPNQ